MSHSDARHEAKESRVQRSDPASLLLLVFSLTLLPFLQLASEQTYAASLWRFMQAAVSNRASSMNLWGATLGLGTGGDMGEE